MNYLIIIDHLYKLADDPGINWSLELNLNIKESPISFSGGLTCFSNTEQKYVELDKSIITEFLTNEESKICINYYENIKDNYIKYLTETITTKEQLDKYINKLNYPVTQYNYKLLNVFTFEELEYISNELFTKYVLLDPNNFKNFKPNKLAGWYGLGIELNTDSDTNDYPEILHLIDNDEIVVTAKEALQIMKKEKDLKVNK